MSLTIIVGVFGYFVFSLVFIALVQVFKEWYAQDTNAELYNLADIVDINQNLQRKKEII